MTIKIRISEKDVQTTVLQWLAAKRIFHYRQNTGAVKTDDRFIRFGSPGAPDIIAVIGGRYIGIECKGSGTHQNADQKEFEAHLRKSGGLYILARSVEDVESRLKVEFTRGKPDVP